MIHGQNVKYVALVKPSSIATNATASGTFSRAGFNYAQVICHMDTAAATSTISVLQLLESDGTTYATISGFVGGTHFTNPVPQTNTQDIVVFNIDLRGRKKNIKFHFEGTNTARIISALAILSRATVAPITAANYGDTITVVNG